MSKGEQTRRQIVDRALAMASEVGLEAVTLGVLADQLQLSKSGLFAHFRSKEALQLAVMEEAVERFTRQVVLPALALPRGEPRLRGLFEHYLRWIKEGDGRGGCLFMSLSYEYDDRPGPVRDALVRAQKDWASTLTRVAKSGVDAGDLRADADPEQVGYELLALCMAFQHNNKLLQNPRAEKHARAAFEALLDRVEASPRRKA